MLRSARRGCHCSAARAGRCCCLQTIRVPLNTYIFGQCARAARRAHDQGGRESRRRSRGGSDSQPHIRVCGPRDCRRGRRRHGAACRATGGAKVRRRGKRHLLVFFLLRKTSFMASTFFRCRLGIRLVNRLGMYGCPIVGYRVTGGAGAAPAVPATFPLDVLSSSGMEM